jgi:hypothetical protein
MCLRDQPLTTAGARVYYLRSILHDWDDSKALEILQHIQPAMKREYSKLLINEWIIPDEGAALYPSLLDINMMAMFSSMERTESQWRTLLHSAGFESSNFGQFPGMKQHCIEAVPVDR